MLLYWILLPIVWPLLHILWRIEVVGKENIPRGRAHVIASNHLSDLDPVYILEAVFSWEALYHPGQAGAVQKSADRLVFELHGARCPLTAARAIWTPLIK